VIILTKKDKLTKTRGLERLESLKSEIPFADQITVIPFSAVTGDGVSEVRAIIEELSEESGDEHDG
jgi:GTP-binding protein